MLLRRVQKERSTSDELRREVLELRKLADRLRDHAEQLATRSEELEKLVQRARSSETKSP